MNMQPWGQQYVQGPHTQCSEQDLTYSQCWQVWSGVCVTHWKGEKKGRDKIDPPVTTLYLELHVGFQNTQGPGLIQVLTAALDYRWERDDDPGAW